MNEMTAALTCPKCSGAMRSYERNGIVVDQCAECRGVFLDRGELERLIEAESAYYRPVAAAGPDAGAGAARDRFGGPDAGGYGDRDRYDRRRDDDRWDDDDDSGGRRRGGFLGGLLDLD
jgi:Zn-finger nucleic acid-binding protein